MVDVPLEVPVGIENGKRRRVGNDHIPGNMPLKQVSVDFVQIAQRVECADKDACDNDQAKSAGYIKGTEVFSNRAGLGAENARYRFKDGLPEIAMETQKKGRGVGGCYRADVGEQWNQPGAAQPFSFQLKFHKTVNLA